MIQHKLTNINQDSNTATCSVCGPIKIGRSRKIAGTIRFVCSSKTLEDRRKWIESKPEDYKNSRRKATLKWAFKRDLEKYNITEEQYIELLTLQDNKCKLCSNELKKKSELSYRVGVLDHCHSSGKLRGILCNDCNIGLGMFKDNIQTLKNAIDYLN